MDILLIIFAFGLLVMAIAKALRRRTMSAGEEGEYYVAKRLRRLNDSKYFVINAKCGGTLVRRTGTYGAFYGCSRYPYCKYTHPAI
jgi:hypothetical protein